MGLKFHLTPLSVTVRPGVAIFTIGPVQQAPFIVWNEAIVDSHNLINF